MYVLEAVTAVGSMPMRWRCRALDVKEV